MMVRRTLKLWERDRRKSTRHRYTPSSRSSTLFRDRVAGSVTVRKYPRSSRMSFDFQCEGTSECVPRRSKLWTNDNVKESVRSILPTFENKSDHKMLLHRMGGRKACLIVPLLLMLILAHRSESHLPFTKLNSGNKAMPPRPHPV
jgi:hypothetical protein